MGHLSPETDSRLLLRMATDMVGHFLVANCLLKDTCDYGVKA